MFSSLENLEKMEIKIKNSLESGNMMCPPFSFLVSVRIDMA